MFIAHTFYENIMDIYFQDIVPDNLKTWQYLFYSEIAKYR